MNEIIQGDCLEVMKTFPDNHFSAIVTDPPYGLHFMGKDWDRFKKTNFDEKPDKHFTVSRGWVRNIRCANTASGEYDPKRDDEFQSFIQKVALEALRITKPGGHCVMFGAPRRFHRQICAIEDAGWEIRDNLCWLFGSGFPKSHNHFGIPGFGTALKPAYEPIILAMKPLDGTFAQNAEKWGQAGINIDGCRIPSNGEHLKPEVKGRGESFLNERQGMYTVGRGFVPTNCKKGRWPANVIFDEEAAVMLDEQSGTLKSGKPMGIRKANHHWSSVERGTNLSGFGDSGGASRFFYCAKTSSKERNVGLDGLKNVHPTIKPLALMKYLITLISPPTNALILDPFAGSGSTILAAKQLGISALGIEKQPEYCEIAKARLNHVEQEPQLDLFSTNCDRQKKTANATLI